MPEGSYLDSTHNLMEKSFFDICHVCGKVHHAITVNPIFCMHGTFIIFVNNEDA